jgi:putative hydrolase of the HAD superfamily
MIKGIIFDLDDTICDYQKAKKNAIIEVNNTLKKANINLEKFWGKYNFLEPKLFREFLILNISRDEYRIRRYTDILKDLVKNSDEMSVCLNKIYMNNANKKIELFNDVKPFIKLLKDKQIEMAILTNGPADGQRDKYSALGLETLIPKIYIGEEIGFAKPNHKSFEYVLNDLSLKASQTVMIGDSIKDDYEGAEKAGIVGVLIDRLNKHVDFEGRKIGGLSEYFGVARPPDSNSKGV